MVMINSIQNNGFVGSSIKRNLSPHLNNKPVKAPTASDVFVKNTANITFTGSGKPGKGDNLPDALKKAGIKGIPFLLGLATGVGMSKIGDKAEGIIFDEEGFEVSEGNVSSDMVNISSDEGIIKIEGTGIDIDADKYDYVDWDNLVFKNYDGSVDIDLLNNKYIDVENGIFVDPEFGVSAVLDGDHFENIAIPSFGSGYACHPWDTRWSEDQAYWAEKNGIENDEPNVVEDGFIKTAIHHLKKLFTSDSKTIEAEDYKDIFGNDILQTTDAKGDSYLTSAPSSENPIFVKTSTVLKSQESAAEIFNNAKLSAYIEDKFPAFSANVTTYEADVEVADVEVQTKYDLDKANEVLEKVAQDGGYYPEPGSEEAINFAKYQNEMLKSGIWDKPMVSPNLILDLDGDGVPDVDLDGDGIPDYDIDGDGVIDLSSERDGGLIKGIFDAFKDLFN